MFFDPQKPLPTQNHLDSAVEMANGFDAAKSVSPKAWRLVALAGVVCASVFSHQKGVEGFPGSPLRFPLPTWSVGCNPFWGTCNKPWHLAEDVVARAGTEVVSPARGKVREAQTHDGYGGTVLIESVIDGETVVFVIGHLNVATLKVVKDHDVEPGDPLGEVGTQEQNGGWHDEHVHLGIRRGPYQQFGTSCGQWIYHGYTTCESEFTDWYIPSDFINCHVNGDRSPDSRDTWSFGTSRNCWFLRGGAIDRAFSAPGAWITTALDDPQVVSPPLAIDAARYAGVRLRLANTSGNRNGRVYFSTGSGFSEPRSMGFDIPNDGQYHDREVDFSLTGEWSGVITQLRIDLVEAGAGAAVGLASISLIPRVGGGAPPGPPLWSQQLVGNRVTLWWTAGPGGAPSYYTVSVGTAAGRSDYGTVNVGGNTSASGTLPDGIYYMRITATNAFGSATSVPEAVIAVGASRPGRPTVNVTTSGNWSPQTGLLLEADPLRRISSR